jgi:hypothetical protein
MHAKCKQQSVYVDVWMGLPRCSGPLHTLCSMQHFRQGPISTVHGVPRAGHQLWHSLISCRQAQLSGHVPYMYGIKWHGMVYGIKWPI